MKRILITTAGSRGDVQPFLALAVGLRQAGYHVKLLASEEFRASIESQGVAFVPMRVDIRALMESKAGHEAMEGGTNPFVFLSRFMELARSVADKMAEDIRDAAKDADAIVHNLITWIPAQATAAECGIPTINVHLQPVTPSSEYPPVFVPWRHDLPGVFHSTAWWLFETVTWQFVRKIGNEIRARHFGLPPLGRRHPNRRGGPLDCMTLHAYSPLLVPKPKEWSEHHHVTGYFLLPEPPQFQPEPRLARFLASGTPPIYIGFGSMSIQSPMQEVALLVEAVQMAGARAVLAAGWSGIEETRLPDDVLLIGETPHAWMFRQVGGVIHHGGAGTTAAALEAGVPQLLCPFMADQPFWGHRLQALGVGPKPIMHRQLSAPLLAERIRELIGNPRHQERAREVGALIRQEDGIGRAVELIARVLDPDSAGNRPLVGAALSLNQ